MLPDVIAMLFADDVHRDSATGKYFVHGTYSAIGVPHFPWTHPVLLVYMAFTGGKGTIPLRLRLIDAGEQRPPLLQTEQPLRIPSLPGAVVESAFYATDIEFPEQGEYRFQLFGDNLLLRERRLLLYRADVNGRPRKK